MKCGRAKAFLLTRGWGIFDDFSLIQAILLDAQVLIDEASDSPAVKRLRRRNAFLEIRIFGVVLFKSRSGFIPFAERIEFATNLAAPLAVIVGEERNSDMA